MANNNIWDKLLKGAPKGWAIEDLIGRQISYDENILNKLESGQMSEEDAARFLNDPNRSRYTYPIGPGESGNYPPSYENPVSTPTEDDMSDILYQEGAVSEENMLSQLINYMKPKAHENIDNLIDENERKESGMGEILINSLFEQLMPDPDMSEARKMTFELKE